MSRGFTACGALIHHLLIWRRRVLGGVVPRPTVVAEALAQHIEQFPPAPDGSLFSTRFGQPFRGGHFGLIFARAVASAGLPAGTTSHDLRYAYASWLLDAGESVVAVAERLGHKNATLVLSTYGHLMPGREEATRRAVDATLGVTSVSHLAIADKKPIVLQRVSAFAYTLKRNSTTSPSAMT